MEDSAVTRPNIRFEWTINAGHVLQAIALLAGLGVFTYTYIVSQANFRAELKATNDTFSAEIAASKQRADVWIPVITELQSSRRLADERLSNVIEAVREGRQNNTNTLAILGGVREDLAAIKVKLDIGTNTTRR